MSSELFLRGLAIGFAVAFALGPIGLLVIRRTGRPRLGLRLPVRRRRRDGRCDVRRHRGVRPDRASPRLLVGIDRPLGIVGGAFLVVLAAGRCDRRCGRPMRPRPAPNAAGSTRPLAAWASMVALTLTNPATILSFGALFASIGAGTNGGPAGRGQRSSSACSSAPSHGGRSSPALIAGFRARLTPRVDPLAEHRVGADHRRVRHGRDRPRPGRVGAGGAIVAVAAVGTINPSPAVRSRPPSCSTGTGPSSTRSR